MSMSDIVDRVLVGGMNLVRARVSRVDADGRIHVAVAGSAEVRCDVLAGEALGRHWAPGEEVLVALPHRGRERPVLLGAIASGLAPAPAAGVALPAAAGTTLAPESATPEATPVETSTIRNARIVVEAGEELVLRCGAGTITIRKDGKIIICGEHVLSRARGTQRIKGGSVAIN